MSSYRSFVSGIVKVVATGVAGLIGWFLGKLEGSTVINRNHHVFGHLHIMTLAMFWLITDLVVAALAGKKLWDIGNEQLISWSNAMRGYSTFRTMTDFESLFKFLALFLFSVGLVLGYISIPLIREIIVILVGGLIVLRFVPL